MVGIKTPLPKTAETVQLMSRWLVEPEPFLAVDQESHEQQQGRAERGGPATRPREDLENYFEDPETGRQIHARMNCARSPGSSARRWASKLSYWQLRRSSSAGAISDAC